MAAVMAVMDSSSRAISTSVEPKIWENVGVGAVRVSPSLTQ